MTDIELKSIWRMQWEENDPFQVGNAHFLEKMSIFDQKTKKMFGSGIPFRAVTV